MASAGCFLERRPLVASNLSRPPPSHPLEKEDNFHRDASPSVSIFPLHWIYTHTYTYTPSLFGMVNYPSFPYILAYIRVSSFSFWNLEHLWTNEIGKEKSIWWIYLFVTRIPDSFILVYFHTVKIRVYITITVDCKSFWYA